MITVREASFELFRAHGMTTMFGNTGSTELPMLSGWPDDFTSTRTSYRSVTCSYTGCWAVIKRPWSTWYTLSLSRSRYPEGVCVAAPEI